MSGYYFSPQSKKILGSMPGWDRAFLCVVSTSSLCVLLSFIGLILQLLPLTEALAKIRNWSAGAVKWRLLLVLRKGLNERANFIILLYCTRIMVVVYHRVCKNNYSQFLDGK